MLTLFPPMRAKFCWTYPQQLPTNDWIHVDSHHPEWCIPSDCSISQYSSVRALLHFKKIVDSYVAILAFKTNHCGCREFLVFRCFVSWWIRLAHFWGLPLACHQFSYDEFRPCDEILRLDVFFQQKCLKRAFLFVDCFFLGRQINKTITPVWWWQPYDPWDWLVYIPTWMVDFYGKCWWIYRTWILWDMASRKCCSLLFFFDFFFPKNLRFVAWNLHLEIRRWNWVQNHFRMWAM